MHGRRAWSLFAALVLSVAGIGVVPAEPATAATTWQYPSTACPVNGASGLQDCIGAAAPGDTIVLTSQINPDGPVVIRKSLTLKGATRTLEPRLPAISVTNELTPVDVTLQDIRVRTEVRVTFDGTVDGHDVTLRRISVGKGVTDAKGVTFETRAASSFRLEQSYVRNSGGGTNHAVLLATDDPDGTVDIRVVGNRLTNRGNPDSGSGIYLAATREGAVRATIHNNAIWDVGRCRCGDGAGIRIDARGVMRADVDIVGNTIELSGSNGIMQSHDLSDGGRLTLDVFDNIISHTRGRAIVLETGAPGRLRFRAGYNDRFATAGLALDGQSAGPGNRTVDPRFVDRGSGDLRLRAGSPLIDKGLVCTPGGLSIRDAAGRHRLAGKSVDIGAYERGAGSASGVVSLGTSGNDRLFGFVGKDILCGFGGNDTLCARDGTGGDYLDGGSGRDKARSDAGDARRSVEATGGSCAL